MILVLVDQGSEVSIDGGRILIETKDLKRMLPKELVESVLVFGNIKMTTPFVHHCLRRNVPLAYFSKSGKYLGRTKSLEGYNMSRIKKQLYLTEDLNFTLPLSKTIIEAKTNNQLVILRRFNKNKLANTEIGQIKSLKNKIDQAKSLEELLGYEGNIARFYYAGISKLIKKEFQFKKRTRRPPKDPFNSMISLGYTILLNEILGHIESVGLISYAGFLHGHARNYPSLASDLIEEYRAVIVDSMVISLINTNRVSLEDFDQDQEGVYIKKDALKLFLSELHKKLMIKHKYLTYIDKELTYRETLYHQARSLSKAIENQDPYQYQAIRIR